MATLLGEQEVILPTSKKLLFSSQPIKVHLVSNKSRKYNGDLPVWKLDYESPENCSLYVSPYTGKIKLYAIKDG